MDRRRFFSVLPLSLLGLPTALKVEPEKPAEESIWVEMDCTRPAYYQQIEVEPERWEKGKKIGASYKNGPMIIPPCGTRFKALRIEMTPYCPRCGWAQDISSPEIRKKFLSPQVKK